MTLPESWKKLGVIWSRFPCNGGLSLNTNPQAKVFSLAGDKQVPTKKLGPEQMKEPAQEIPGSEGRALTIWVFLTRM